MADWTPEQSAERYLLPRWGAGYFHVNHAGHVAVRTSEAVGDQGDLPDGIDLHSLTLDIARRGIQPPILLRFDGILRSRARKMRAAFDQAREEYGYEAPYAPVFPIKVNQNRHLVDSLVSDGHLGLEVGSKSELLAVMALYSGSDRLVICNGYKDVEYIELALQTRRLGTETIIVIERPSELDTVIEVSTRMGVQPVLGVRTKLGGAGSGRWKHSGGDRSKFGLTTRQTVLLADTLRERGMLDRLQLLHFHLGSQITQIRAIKRALREATRTFVGLHGIGAPIRWFDVGGGLGVDYDGSAAEGDSSVNYTLQEYANDVVYHLREACTLADLPQPAIVTESGRALTAHHAVLVSEVLGTSDFTTITDHVRAEEGEHEIIKNFREVADAITPENRLESFHDAWQLRDEGMTLFNVGHLSLHERARVEEFYWRTCAEVLRVSGNASELPEELQDLHRDMASTYYLNLSIFQSIPDAWAIDQIFPILPIHRLDEEPTCHAVLADITCDSDGKIDHFIGEREASQTLDLHPLIEGQPYYIGVFLVGAYQEILGDMHNLFGDTHVVHVDTDEDGRPDIAHVVRGDRVQDVLSYVEYFEADLLASMRMKIEEAIRADRIGLEDSASLQQAFESGLAGYTYLRRDANQKRNRNQETEQQ